MIVHYIIVIFGVAEILGSGNLVIPRQNLFKNYGKVSSNLCWADIDGDIDLIHGIDFVLSVGRYLRYQ